MNSSNAEDRLIDHKIDVILDQVYEGHSHHKKVNKQRERLKKMTAWVRPRILIVGMNKEDNQFSRFVTQNDAEPVFQEVKRGRLPDIDESCDAFILVVAFISHTNFKKVKDQIKSLCKPFFISTGSTSEIADPLTTWISDYKTLMSAHKAYPDVVTEYGKYFDLLSAQSKALNAAPEESCLTFAEEGPVDTEEEELELSPDVENRFDELSGQISKLEGALCEMNQKAAEQSRIAELVDRAFKRDGRTQILDEILSSLPDDKQDKVIALFRSMVGVMA